MWICYFGWDKFSEIVANLNGGVVSCIPHELFYSWFQSNSFKCLTSNEYTFYKIFEIVNSKCVSINSISLMVLDTFFFKYI